MILFLAKKDFANEKVSFPEEEARFMFVRSLFLPDEALRWSSERASGTPFASLSFVRIYVSVCRTVTWDVLLPFFSSGSADGWK